MDKRGNSLHILGFLFVLFLLFLLLKSPGHFNLSGYVISDGESNISITEVLFSKLNVLNGSSFELIDTTEFSKKDNIGCVVNYNANGNETFSLTIGFYSNEGSINDPDRIYVDIFNDSIDDTICDEVQHTCLAYYNITEYIAGEWRCFATYLHTTNSNVLQMVNGEPLFLRPIQSLALEVDGSYSNESVLDLDDYFVDPEGDQLVYGVVGQRHINISIGNDGVVRFTNPTNWEGVETIIFRAYDGEIGTFSNNISIAVGSGINQLPPQVCSPFWDCSWNECQNGRQTCTYFDRNTCSVETGRPSDLIRDCTSYQMGEQGAASQTGPQLTNEDLALSVTKPSITGTKRGLLFVGIVVLVLLIIGGAVYLFISARKKSKVKTGEQKAVVATTSTNSSNEIVNYITAALQQGQSEQKVKEDLLKAGWQKTDVSGAFNHIKLRNFVNEKIKAGFSKDKIIESLKMKG